MSPSCARTAGGLVELDALGDQVEGFIVSSARFRHHRLPVIGPIRRGLFFKHAIELFLRPIEVSPRISASEFSAACVNAMLTPSKA